MSLAKPSVERSIFFPKLPRHRVCVPVSALTNEPDPAPPASLVRLLAAAETLAARFDFVRVDFYEIGGRPLFGEMTFYPGSGVDRFNPVALDSMIR